MSTTSPEIPVGARVELLPERENVYRFARAGARARVIDSKEDDYGYPLVYVEWDDGVSEPNCWTFASHFKILKAPQHRGTSPSLESMVEKAQEERQCPTCGKTDDPEADRLQGHIDLLMTATEAAGSSEGYAVITMERQHDEQGGFTIVPKVFLSTMTPLGGAVVEAQVMRLAHIFHSERIDQSINEAVKDDGR